MNKKEWVYIDYHAKTLRAKNMLGGKCEICGNDNHEQLEFHHKDKDDKEFGINTIIEHRWSKIEKEVKKCRLLCSCCHRKLHYDEAQQSKRTETRRKNKEVLLECFGEFSCEKCGYSECKSALDFHHINPNEKEVKISDHVSNKKWENVSQLEEDISKELDKCVLLCANCHITEHFDKDRFEKYYDQILHKSKNMKEVQPPLDRQVVLEMLLAGKKQVEIAKHFNASKGTISAIVKKFKEDGLI